MAMCIRPHLAPSTAYKYYKCRCERCNAWKKDAADRTNNRELAKERSRIWRLNNLERSRQNSKNYQKNNPDKLLQWQLKKYNLTIEQYKSFGETCMICGGFPKGMQYSKNRICVDHDKFTGKVRGVLCGQCNIGLGHFEHNIRTLEKAISYLKLNGDVY